MPVPTSPTNSAFASAGRMLVTMGASGVGMSFVEVEIATDTGYTTNRQYTVIYTSGNGEVALFTNLVPGSLYYVRSRWANGSGVSAWAANATSTTPAANALDSVAYASIVIDNTITVSLRSSGGVTPVITLGYSNITDGTTWNSIGVVPTTSASEFGLTGGHPNDLALVADPDGNIFVIGRRGTSSAILIKRYRRDATTTWVSSGQSYQSISADIPNGFGAAYVPGVGSSPKPSIFVVPLATVDGSKRFPNNATAAEKEWATVDPAAVAVSSATPFINSGVTGAYVAVRTTGKGRSLDLRRMSATSNRIAAYSGAFLTVVDVVNGGAPTQVSRASFFDDGGDSAPLVKSRILAIDANTVAAVFSNGVSGALYIRFYTTAGTLLGTATYASANVQGAAWSSQWDAYYEPISGSVRIYYIADDDPRKVERVDVNPSTFTVSALTVVTSTLGAASTTNPRLRIPRGIVDERRILIEAGNVASGPTLSIAAFSDTSAEVVPSAPAITDISSFDATAAYLFTWLFGDPNANDVQTAYELQIQRVSDSVDVVSTGKVTSAVSSRSVAGSTLTNGVNYRWRVRTYDALDQVGTWSGYDAFSTSASGTLTITVPASDNPPGLNTAQINVSWVYTQPNGYVQTQRRVRLIRVSDSAVLHDSGMTATALSQYVGLTAVPSGVPVRIEVTIVTNAPGTPTIGPATRLLTTTYASPTTPTFVASLETACILISTTNPPPSGDMPTPTLNYIERRLLGTTDNFVAVGQCAPNGVYRDHAVRSGVDYEYRVRAVAP